jgi:hypothetical protein
MYRKFLNARSPLRLLEKGLHGGLGKGKLGLVLAGHGVGKTACLVGIALDDLLRGGHVLHVSLDHTVSHVRDFYDTVFEDLASTTQLVDGVQVHAEVDRRRSIRAYPTNSFSASKLREAVKVEAEAGAQPGLVIVEGFDFEASPRDELLDLRGLAEELEAEVWLSAALPEERVGGLPDSIEAIADTLDVILALEPGKNAVALRALKDHDNPDPSKLRVSLDPKTLLLTRS